MIDHSHRAPPRPRASAYLRDSAMLPIRVLSHLFVPCALLISASAPAADAARCHAGAYRLDDGTIVDITPLSDAGKLRWRLVDGRVGRLEAKAGGGWTSTRGWTERPDGVAVDFGTCAQKRITFEGRAGRKLAFDVTETTFKGNGVELKGRLVMPKGNEQVPIIVEVHGSENYSAVAMNHAQNMFPANGIGVFVYDKRGTGGSSGKYTQDFYLLSDDAKAALLEASRLAGERAGRIGFHGGSQAGWIEPLAASKTDVDFLVVGYGMAVSALGEDRGQVMLDLRTAGYGDDVLAKAREVTDATGAIVASNGARGWEQLDAARAKYGKEPWWTAMKGEYTGDVVGHTRQELEAMAPQMDQGTSWEYEPLPVLRALRAPVLWILAGSDREAPPEETRANLLALRAGGAPITVVEFPDTDHGIHTFETIDGKRVDNGTADGYFRLQMDWIKTGRLDNAPYGAAKALTK